MSEYPWIVFEGMNTIAHEDYLGEWEVAHLGANVPRFSTLAFAKRWLARRSIKRNRPDPHPRYWKDGP